MKEQNNRKPLATVPRLVGSGRIPGFVQLHQALPLVERQHALIEELRARAPGSCQAKIWQPEQGPQSGRSNATSLASSQPVCPSRSSAAPAAATGIDARRELPPLTLTPGEASALVASLVAVGPYISAAAQTALTKLLATLTSKPTPRN